MAGLAHVSDFFLTRFFPRLPRRFTPAAVRLLRMQRRADITKARTELGYRPTNIVAAISEAYDDFVRRGQIIPVAEQARGAGARKANQRASGVDASAAPGLDEARI